MKIIKLIQAIFLYITALIGVVMVTISAVSLIDYGVEVYIFGIREDTTYIYGNCDKEYINGEYFTVSKEEEKACKEKQLADAKENWKRQVANDIANDIALLLVGIPLWVWGWRTGRKSTQED